MTKKILVLGDFLYTYDFIAKDIEEIAKYIKINNYKVILNLEGPIIEKNDEKIKKRGANLYQDNITIDILKKLNVVGVCLANNHIMDYGKKGLINTIELLKKNNIKYCGAGINLEEALKPMEIQIDKKKIKFINYGWNVEETVYAKKNKAGAAPLEQNIILRQINKIKKDNQNNFLIGIMHWGFEYNLYPMPKDIYLAHRMIEYGTDIIIGHHSHNVQAFEKYKGKQIYYSLGNFYFSERRKNFKVKRFKYEIENMCDYGIGLIINTNTQIVEKEIIFFYDIEKDSTQIIENQELQNKLKENITNININDKTYIKKIKSTSKNINPILGKNKLVNTIKINNLYIKYKLLRIMKKIKRRKKQ